MRVDKFLKLSRLIKRRTLAASAAASGRVLVNGKAAKPGHQLAEGDELVIKFGEKPLKIRVKKVDENVRKENAETLYEVIE